MTTSNTNKFESALETLMDDNEKEELEKTSKINKVVDELSQLNEMFKSMETLIRAGDSKLERIDQIFENTKINLQQGNQELKESIDYISKDCVNY